MAANQHQIPDLRTLLASRRGAPSRGRGRGRGGPGAAHEDQATLRDQAVRGTDQDAAGSRASCVELGYLHDPYAKLFATQPSTRRLPLLNRGTYVRTSAIDLLVDKFLTTDPSSPKQIVSLGAGTDTRYFRLRDAYPGATVVYHEIDFPTNTAAKLSSIRRHSQLLNKLASSSNDQAPALVPAADSYDSATYNLHALDLRSLASTKDGSSTGLPNLSPSTPTLILSEMCLIYLQPRAVSDILAALVGKHISTPTPVSIIFYEPILPEDAFGRTMISNLSTRNIHLPTLSAYPDLPDQRQRLRKYGFETGFCAADTHFIWREWVGDEEKARVAGLEMLDEHEELDLLLKHYCVAWGWRDGPEDKVFSSAWGQVREQGKG